MTNIRIPQRAYGLLSRNTHPASREAQANDDVDGASLHCRVHVLWLHIIHRNVYMYMYVVLWRKGAELNQLSK